MRPLQRMQVLWAALFSTVGVYLVVLLSMRGQMAATQPPAQEMVWALAAAALGSFVASVLLPRSLHQRAARAAAAQLATRSAFSEQVPGIEGLRDAPRARQVFADPEAARDRAYQLAFTPMILACALRESVVLYGFVLGFLGHPPVVWAPFFAVGALGLAALVPTEARVLDGFARATGVGFAQG